MTKLIQMLTHVECVPGPLVSMKTVTDLDAFRALAVTCNALVAIEWVPGAVEDEIREWFSRVDGVNSVVVQCRRPATVVDWTEKNESERWARTSSRRG